MLNPNITPLEHYTFARLGEVLGPVGPQVKETPIHFSIGEPQNQPPVMLARTIADHAELWNKYPPAAGDAAFREAAAAWLGRRFDLAGGDIAGGGAGALVDPDRHIIPVPGTREPLYQLGFLCTPPEKDGAQPATLIPNPFYHVYQGAAMVGGAEPVYLTADRGNNFLPDLDALPESLLRRTSLFYLCTPTNPQGAVADMAYLKRAITLARTYDFTIAFDECYCEIWREKPPVGALEAAAALGEGLANIVSFQSLSKRSSAAGLRSGFLVGDAEIIKRYRQFVTFGGAPLPLPVLHASTALWNDDDHVAVNRDYYARNFQLAEEILGPRTDLFMPAAGFFLWIEVGDGCRATRKLWHEAAVSVLPGELMGRADETGRNPGFDHIRIALVHDAEITARGLRRLADTLF